MTRAWIAVVAACGSSAPHRAPEQREPEPKVDLACVQRAKDGKLTADLPARIGPFAVTARARGVHLQRDGRVVDDSDGQKLWDAFTRELAIASIARSSHAKTCADADVRTCLDVHLWACQLPLEAFAMTLADTLDRAGFADARLAVDVTLVEAAGPPCRDGAACKPMQHYSTHGTYVPNGARHALDPGRGACADDGDCDGRGQLCQAWYLTGGAETLIYEHEPAPTFCGCIDNKCAWFRQ
ncbi:MAG TPA: hypothetical protein VMJ10_16825 [Kofleriaceae bacterium]|nr:hypothetical protein [Kofleriaceae bacterium]